MRNFILECACHLLLTEVGVRKTPFQNTQKWRKVYFKFTFTTACRLDMELLTRLPFRPGRFLDHSGEASQDTARIPHSSIAHGSHSSVLHLSCSPDDRGWAIWQLSNQPQPNPDHQFVHLVSCSCSEGHIKVQCTQDDAVHSKPSLRWAYAVLGAGLGAGGAGSRNTCFAL